MSNLLHVNYVILDSLCKLYVSFTSSVLETTFSSNDLKNQFCDFNGPKDFHLAFTIFKQS